MRALIKSCRQSDRVFEIEVNGASRHVSVKNVKPANFLRNDIDHLDPLRNVTQFTSQTAFVNADHRNDIANLNGNREN